MSALADDSKGPSGTLARGLAILDLLAAGERPTVTELVIKLELSRSATYRILSVLREQGLVAWDSADSGIYPGEKAIMLGMAGLSHYDPYLAARQELTTMAEEIGEAILLGVRHGAEIVYIAHEDRGVHMVSVRRMVGMRFALNTTSMGKAFLAQFPDDFQEDLLNRIPLARMTDRTITDKEVLRRELDRIRERGYAVDDGENAVGVMCFGAAVCDDAGWPVCGIAISGPKERMMPRVKELSRRVVESTDIIARRLGFGAAHEQKQLWTGH
ncbi:MAG: IclR family transcriptional regulator [Propionibacteriaceae bacterium]